VGRYVDIARLLGLPAGEEGEGVASLVTAIRQLYQRIGQPASIHELGITAEAFAEALPHLIDCAETDTQIVSAARIPEPEDLEWLFRYAYEGKVIDF